MTPEPFTDARRLAFGRLADALIPPAPGKLSATQAGIAGALLDRVEALVPERLDLLRECLAVAGDRPAQDGLEALRRHDALAYDAFCETIAAAYFMSSAVRGQVGFPGRVAVPARIDPSEMEDLLLPVLEAGFAPRGV